MTRIALVFLVIAITLLTPFRDIRAQEDNLEARIDAFLKERMERLNIPGAALAIVRDGEIVYLKGYGTANAQGDPVTPQTPYLLASLSKSMTALAVMQLVEEGQIELDAPVQRYLPWFVPEQPITVRQLLNQTSGLDELQGYQRNLDPDGPDGLEMSIRKLAETGLNHSPGSGFEYSNSNYDVLGLLIETVSGQSYGDYMRDHIFEPLEMNHTFTDLAAAREAGMSSSLYPFFGLPLPFDWLMPYSRATQPSAGVIGSAEDMAHYLLLHLGDGRFRDQQLISAAGMATLHERGASIGPGVDYAMGWTIFDWPEAAVPGQTSEVPRGEAHGGEGLGIINLMTLIPEHNLGLVLLMSGHDPKHPSAFSNTAFDLALLSLGLETQNSPPGEDWLQQVQRPFGFLIIALLLLGAILALRRLRAPSFTRWDVLFFLALAIVDILLFVWIFFIQLPERDTSLSLALRYRLDIGLLMLIFLLLVVGWGSVRSIWAIWRWQNARRQPLS